MPICGTVSQISPPIRIVLVAAIGLIAAWMLFLRPKTEPDPAPNPRARDGSRRDRALERRRQGQGRRRRPRTRRTRRCSRPPAMTPRRPTPASPAPAKKTAAAAATGRELPLEPPPPTDQGPADAVEKALDTRQVFVLGVFDTKEKRWARMPATTAPCAASCAQDVDRYDGEVVASTATLGELGYARRRHGAGRRADPVGRGRRPQRARRRCSPATWSARDRPGRSRRAPQSSEVRIKDPYLAAASTAPARTSPCAWTASTSRRRAPQIKRGLARCGRLMSAYRDRFAALKAPGQVRPFKRQRRRRAGHAASDVGGRRLRSGNFAKIGTPPRALLASGRGDGRARNAAHGRAPRAVSAPQTLAA